MAWYGLNELPRRASGELVGFEAEVLKQRLSSEYERDQAEEPADGIWQNGGSGIIVLPCKEDRPQQPKPAAPDAAAVPDTPSTPTNSTCRSSLTWGRSVCVAVGDDICTEKVLKYAARYICKAHDQIYLVHLSKSSKSAAASRLLEHAKATLLQSTRGKVCPDQVKTIVVPLQKQVGQSLVAHCKQSGYNILVIGCRGLRLTGMKAKLGSIMGEGSVSKYCADNLRRVTLVVIKPPEGHDWGKS